MGNGAGVVVVVVVGAGGGDGGCGGADWGRVGEELMGGP